MRPTLFVLLILATVLIPACIEDSKVSMRVTGVVDNKTTATRISGAKVHLSAGYMEWVPDIFGGGGYWFHSVGSADTKSKSDGWYDISITTAGEFTTARVTVTAAGCRGYEAEIPQSESLMLDIALEPAP